MRRYILGIRVFLSVFLFIAIVLSSLAYANTSLNTVLLPAESMAAKPSPAQWQQAFSDVLVKYSGNSHVMSIPALQAQVAQAAKWAKSYRYIKQDSTVSPYLLEINFVPKSIANLLTKSGQAVWDPDRATTLVVLSEQDGLLPQVISADNQAAWVNVVKKQAAWRGLPLMLPLWDLQDQSAWRTYMQVSEPIDVALLKLSSNLAQRYALQSRAYALIHPQDDLHSVRIDWSLWYKGSPYTWQSTADTVTAALVSGVNQLADTVANESAALPVTQNLHTVTLWLGDVDSVQTYAKVMNYLQGLDMVSNVSVGDLTATGMLIKIQTRVDSHSLASRLNQDHHWLPLLAGGVPGKPAADLYYQVPYAVHVKQGGENAVTSA